MIGIQLEGDIEFLEIPLETSITIKLENPILSDADRISPGSYSLPFNLPGGEKSPHNAARLKNPDVIENNEAYTVQKATLLASSDISSNVIPFKKGNLKAQNSTNDQIESNFTFGLSTISEDFKTAKLRDVIAENVLISSSDITKKIYVKRIVAGNYDITINGKNYNSVDGFFLALAINNDASAAVNSGKYVPHATSISGGTSPSGLITGDYVVIFLQATASYYDPVTGITYGTSSISTNPLDELGVTTDAPSEYLVESDLGAYFSEYTTFLSGYLTGSYPTDKFRFPLRFNGKPYEETLKQGELVNGVNASGFIFNDPNWGLNNSKPFQIKNYNSLQPFLRRKWILDKIADTFGFAWDGDFYGHPDVENMLEDNSAALDFPMDYIGDNKFVFYKRSFNLSDLVPDITVVEYIKRIKSRYNLATYYNEETQRVRICFRENIAKSIAYDDITSISSPTTGNEDQRITGFTLICKKDDTDLLSLEEKTVVGISQQDIPVDCGRLFGSNGVVLDGKYVSGPRVSQKFGDKGMLRTFYYKGIVDVTTFQYPAADIHGVDIYESFNDFVLLQGIYTKCWKYWLNAKKNNRLVKLKVDFPFRKLIAFNWELKRRFNRSNYLVKSIDLKITNSSIEVTNTELYTST